MSVFGFFKKDMKFLVFFQHSHHNGLIFKIFLKKCDIIFFDIFSLMDNEKGKKGKFFILNFFQSIYHNNYYFGY
jgi:hypothetical protein